MAKFQMNVTLEQDATRLTARVADGTGTDPLQGTAGAVRVRGPGRDVPVFHPIHKDVGRIALEGGGVFQLDFRRAVGQVGREGAQNRYVR